MRTNTAHKQVSHRFAVGDMNCEQPYESACQQTCPKVFSQTQAILFYKYHRQAGDSSKEIAPVSRRLLGADGPLLIFRP
jgi:hypothetical protein